MSEFFALPQVVALQNVQKRNPYGSQAHRDAHKQMVSLAADYCTVGRNGELVRCCYFFGDY